MVRRAAPRPTALRCAAPRCAFAIRRFNCTARFQNDPRLLVLLLATPPHRGPTARRLASPNPTSTPFTPGVVPLHYDVVGGAFLATLEQGLPKGLFTAEVKGAFTKMWGVVSTTMQSDYYKKGL